MGDDIPLAVLSDKPHMLYDYFKQRFAQVQADDALDAGMGLHLDAGCFSAGCMREGLSCVHVGACQ
jgi:hypothetical protein